MSTTYALYGVTPDTEREYIGTWDNEPDADYLETWLENYPAIVVSADTLDDAGHWHSIEQVHTTMTQYFPPMATPMRPQAMTDPQLLNEYHEAVSDAACYLANDDHQYAHEAIHYRNEYAAEIEKRGLLTPADMRYQQEEKYRAYLRMN